MKVYKKIMDGIAFIEKIVLGVVSAVVTVITFANVCVRYLTDTQFAWSEEIVINLFILLIMMGCALSARDGSLISLSLIFDMVGVKAKKIMCVIITIANCVFCGILFKTGLDKVFTQIANGKTTFSLGVPEWMFTIFLPIGCVFLIVHTIEFLVDVLAGQAACVKTEGEDNE